MRSCVRVVPVRAAVPDLAKGLVDKVVPDPCGRMGWRRQAGILEERVGCHAWGGGRSDSEPQGKQQAMG